MTIVTRCKHTGSWLISGGSMEWCYMCGALRKMGNNLGDGSVFPITQWTRPTGDKSSNPWPMKPTNKSK